MLGSKTKKGRQSYQVFDLLGRRESEEINRELEKM